MKKGWPWRPIGEVATVFDGPHATPNIVESGPLFLGISSLQDGEINLQETRHVADVDFKQWTRRVRPRANDVVFAYETRLGQAAIIPENLECCLGRRMGLVRLQEDLVIPRFFLYQYLAPPFSSFLAERTVRGATVDRISIKEFPFFPIAIPSLSEQRRIVGILDEALEGIATAKANAEANVRNSQESLNGFLQAAFTECTTSASVPVGEVAEIFDGPHATPRTVSSGPIFLGISALQDGEINLRETRHVTPEDFARWTRRVKPQANDIVFSYETRLGQAAMIPAGLECCLGRRMGLVRVNPKRLQPLFFVYQFISPPFRRFLADKAIRGATVDRISLNDFPNFPIALPALVEQKRISNSIRLLRRESQHLQSLYQAKVVALESFKRSLLHQAFTGQL